MTRTRPLTSRIRLNARLILERDRARSRELRWLLLCAAALAAPLLGYVWQRVGFLRVSYRLERMQTERQQLLDLNKQMTIERALLMAPERIERLARTRLGLEEPHPENVRRVQVIDGRLDPGGPIARRALGTPGARGVLASAGIRLPGAAPGARP